jgi:hypothetical protein
VVVALHRVLVAAVMLLQEGVEL